MELFQLTFFLLLPYGSDFNRIRIEYSVLHICYSTFHYLNSILMEVLTLSQAHIHNEMWHSLHTEKISSCPVCHSSIHPSFTCPCSFLTSISILQRTGTMSFAFFYVLCFLPIVLSSCLCSLVSKEVLKKWTVIEMIVTLRRAKLQRKKERWQSWGRTGWAQKNIWYPFERRAEGKARRQQYLSHVLLVPDTVPGTLCVLSHLILKQAS